MAEDPSPEALALAGLAESLGLDDRRQKFALALATQPGITQTAAARMVGFRGARAREYGCRKAKEPKVRQYIAAIKATVVAPALPEPTVPPGPSPDERRRLESMARQLEGPILRRQEALRVASTVLLNMASARPGDYMRPEAEAKSGSMWDYEAIRAAPVGVLDGAPTRDETGALHPRMVRPRDVIAAAKLIIDAHDTEVEGKAPAPVNIAVLIQRVPQAEVERATIELLSRPLTSGNGGGHNGDGSEQ